MQPSGDTRESCRRRAPRERRLAALVQVLALAHVLALEACVGYRPSPLESIPFRDRMVETTVDGVRVAAASLGQRESKDLFGVSVGGQGIQPVWIEIANDGPGTVLFLQQSVDPAYFAPIEAARKSHFSPHRRLVGYGLVSIVLWPLALALPFQYFSARSANHRMDEHFVEHAIGNQVIEPGERAAGFVFTHLDEGTKHVRVGLLRRGGSIEADLLTEVPGARLDHHRVDFDALYAPDEVTDLADAAALTAAVEALPAVTTDAKGRGEGDPVNLVVIGTADSVVEAFTRAEWHQTEVLDFGTSMRTFRSFVFGSEYRYSPMSSQYLFGRAQDIAFQRARDSIHERNHFRLWLAPLRLDGRPVWVGQVNRDIGVKFTLRSWTLTTHAVDPDVDDSRENVTGDLLESGRVAYLAYLDGVGPRSVDEPGRNLMNDPFHTDGRRAVFVLFETESLADSRERFLHVRELE